MFCGQCGKSIPDNQKFCPFCGARIVLNSSPVDHNLYDMTSAYMKPVSLPADTSSTGENVISFDAPLSPAPQKDMRSIYIKVACIIVSIVFMGVLVGLASGQGCTLIGKSVTTKSSDEVLTTTTASAPTEELKLLNERIATLNENSDESSTETFSEDEDVASIQGQVLDEEGEPVSDTEVLLKDRDTGYVLNVTSTDDSGNYVINVPKEEYTYTIEIPDSESVTNGFDVDVSEDATEITQPDTYVTNKTEKKETEKQQAEKKEVTPQVTLSFIVDESAHYKDINVTVREGTDTQTGTSLLKTSADKTGIATFDLANGSYTLEIALDGYETVYKNITVLDEDASYDIRLFPTPQKDHYLLAVLWNTDVVDNDFELHLFSEYEDGSIAHTSYEGSDGCIVLDLEVDENTTYAISILDAVNEAKNNSSSKDLSTSDLKIQVYSSEGLDQEFSVPDNKKGVLWSICEIKDDTVTPIDDFYADTDDAEWWTDPGTITEPAITEPAITEPEALPLDAADVFKEFIVSGECLDTIEDINEAYEFDIKEDTISIFLRDLNGDEDPELLVFNGAKENSSLYYYVFSYADQVISYLGATQGVELYENEDSPNTIFSIIDDDDETQYFCWYIEEDQVVSQEVALSDMPDKLIEIKTFNIKKITDDNWADVVESYTDSL